MANPTKEALTNAAVGSRYRLSEDVVIDLSGGMTRTLSSGTDVVKLGNADGGWGILTDIPGVTLTHTQLSE